MNPDFLRKLFERQQPPQREWWAADYFHGYRAHLPHPMSPSTGSEGRCDICGRSSSRDHEPPFQRITKEEYEAEARSDRSVGSDPLAAHPRLDVSYPARQSRLDALPAPKVRTTSGSPSGEKPETLECNAGGWHFQRRDFNIPKEGKTMLRINRSWGPEYLAKAIFDQEDVWITAAGDWKKVPEMDLDHILNTLLFLERVADDLPFPAEELQSKPLYQAMYARVAKVLGAGEVHTSAPVTEREAWGEEGIESLLRASMPREGQGIKGTVLRLDYTDNRGDRTMRRIIPLSFNKAGMVRPVVVARDVDKDELRTFRIDRINSLVVV